MPEEYEEEDEEEFEIEGREIGRKAQPSEYDSAFVGEGEPMQEPEFKEPLVGAEDEEMDRLQEELTSQKEKLAEKKVKRERKRKIGETKREIRKIKYEPFYKASEVAKKGAGAVGKGAVKLAKKYRGTPEQRAERRERTKRVIKKVTARGKEIAVGIASDVKEGKFAIRPEGEESMLFAEQISTPTEQRSEVFSESLTGAGQESMLFAEQGSQEMKKSEGVSKSFTGAGQVSNLLGSGTPGIFAEPSKPQKRKRQIRTIKQQVQPQLLAHEGADILGFGKGSEMDLFGSGSKGDKITGLGGGIMSGEIDLFGNKSKSKKKGKKSKKKEEMRLI